MHARSLSREESRPGSHEQRRERRALVVPAGGLCAGRCHAGRQRSQANLPPLQSRAFIVDINAPSHLGPRTRQPKESIYKWHCELHVLQRHLNMFS